MTDAPRSFAADFPDQDESRWRALVDAALKGQTFEKLVARTADGLDLRPLYRETDIATAGDVSGVPGSAPFVRGAGATRDAYQPWHIRQAFQHPDPAQTNREILADLEGGVSAVELVIDPAGGDGVAIRTLADLRSALDGVLVDLAPISLDAGAHGVEAATLLADYLKDVGPAAAAPHFDIDPVGTQMRTGADPAPAFAAAADLALRHLDHFPAAVWLRVDARPVHEAGGSEAQELGVALAGGIAALRALTDAGLRVADAARMIGFTLAVGADVLVETAKLRALRLGWARILEASGAGDGPGASIHAVTSRRMMTRHDAWTNMLRTTGATFAAAVGGATAITVRPFTEALGLPTPFARRMARNTQLVLMEESRLGHVIDPAGGAWFVEELTRELAQAAWTRMQAIEAQGGIAAALAGGALQQDVALTRQKRAKAFASRRETITGVTDFPLLGQEPPAVAAPWPAHPARTQSAAILAPIRWAEPFEALRDAGEKAKARVFFANLGPLAEFSARANFARNLLAAGGVAALGPEDVHADLTAVARQFSETDTRVAVLCGSDARYAAEGADAAKRLKASGCDWLVYAGKPADEAALRTAGVDQFIFAGQDALEALKTLHAALGVRV